jgi:hypothetical protein
MANLTLTFSYRNVFGFSIEELLTGKPLLQQGDNRIYHYRTRENLIGNTDDQLSLIYICFCDE